MTEHEHEHDEHEHHHHMPRCEVTVTLTADHPFGAGQVLKHISRLLKDGEVAADGVNVKYGVEWDVRVEPLVGDPDALPHTDFLDGEGYHVHVDTSGIVVFRRNIEDDTIEHLLDQGIKISDWAEKHGGISPYDTDDMGPA